MIKIGLLGSRGRMGRWVTRLLLEDYASEAVLTASVGRGESIDPLLGCDVVIDFSSPAAMAEAARRAVAQKASCAWIVGSTGWDLNSQGALEELALHSPVLQASNFSTGVLALREILGLAGPLLTRLGYQPVIVEAHHQHKKDAPSGTAILLQKSIRPDQPEAIQTHSIRAGEIIGDHEVRFHGPSDHLTLGHFAQDRSIFARGAIDAALWLVQNQDRWKAEKRILQVEEFFRDKFLAQA